MRRAAPKRWSAGDQVKGVQYLTTATNALDLEVFLREHLIGVRLAVADRGEVWTSSSNAIVVINFPMMGLRVGASHDHGNGKLDHKVRQTSRFVKLLQHSGVPAMPLGSFWFYGQG